MVFFNLSNAFINVGKVQPRAPKDCHISMSYLNGLKEIKVLCDEQPPRTLARECLIKELPTNYGKIRCNQTRGVRLTHRLLCGTVIIIELATKQVQPLLQIEDAVVHKIARAGLDEKHLEVVIEIGEAGTTHSVSRHIMVDTARSIEWCAKNGVANMQVNLSDTGKQV